MEVAKSVDTVRLKPDLLTTEEAAAYLGVSPGTLEVWRSTKRYGLPYIKLGRNVRYRRTGLDAFLQARTVGTAALQAA